MQLFLSNSPDCKTSTNCGGGGCDRSCKGGVTGKATIQMKRKASVLVFAPGRRPYVRELSGALVAQAAPVANFAPWIPAGVSGANTTLEITASLALPGGPMQLFAAPQILLAEETRSLPFNFTGVPTNISALITATVTVKSRTGQVLMVVNSTRLFQRYVPRAEMKGGVVQLDRHRRALLVDGSVYQGSSHWRDCHFADALSPSLLIHLLKVEGGAAE